MSAATVVTVYNRAGGDTAMAQFETAHVPHVGELVYAWPSLLGDARPSFEAFGKQSVWRVDQVVWQVADPGSEFVRRFIREFQRSTPGGLLSRVDLLCWPDTGPFWHDTPEWAPSKGADDE